MPNAAHQLGHAGEDAAVAYLIGHGYTVLYRGYRHGRAEVDMVAQLGPSLLIFVEVKTRSSSQYGYAETFVTERKKQLFRQAAEQLQHDLNWTGDIRFDILALLPTAAGLRIEHFEDAFY